MSSVLVVEDESAIAELISINLRHAGYEVTVAASAEQAQAAVDAVLPDLVLLDWMLPGQSGVHLARQWRGAARTRELPMIMLTARADESDKIAGLDAGADDYLPKPFATEELLARIRALLRRRAPGDDESQILTFANVRVDPDRFEAWRGGRPLHLTRTEFSLLQVLVRNATRVLTRDALFEAIWGFDMSATANNLQVYVSYLRRKLEAEGEPRLIYTLRGLGYTLRETPP
jgi:two-component system response regulator MprA